LTDGTASGHEGRKKPKGIPIKESALRDVEAAAIGQQVLVFEAATGRGIEAFDRADVPPHFFPALAVRSSNVFGRSIWLPELAK
jgi:hypothetical protein